MARLKIRNVGPIKGGFDSEDGFLDFDGVTLFIGDQGTGKSTVAKVFSHLSWVEKALVRGDFTVESMEESNRFEEQLEYLNIRNYLNDKSHIEYFGKGYEIIYRNRKLEITRNKEEGGFRFPKIMYVPSERNFVSTVDRPDQIKRLPRPLYTFLDEYEAAKHNIKNIGTGLSLPIEGIRFEYDELNKNSYLRGKDYRINLLEASSGFQSLVPLVLVTHYLTRIVHNPGLSTHREISLEEEQKIRKEIEEIYDNKNLSDDVKGVLIEKVSARFKPAYFLNIVEEPEQNLYPSSQKAVLFELLKQRGIDPKGTDQLVITTHSPYIVNYLTIAIKAKMVKEKIKDAGAEEALVIKLNKIIPGQATVDKHVVNIYQIDNTGSIAKLPDYMGIPSDSNLLNESLAESNLIYDQLLEIEEEI